MTIQAGGGFHQSEVSEVSSATSEAWRREEDEQLERIASVIAIAQECDIVVLHEGPHGDDDQRGSAAIRELLDASAVPLTVCGHCHWDNPLADAERGQILNVDARVLVLQAESVRC